MAPVPAPSSNINRIPGSSGRSIARARQRELGATAAVVRKSASASNANSQSPDPRPDPRPDPHRRAGAILTVPPSGAVEACSPR